MWIELMMFHNAPEWAAYIYVMLRVNDYGMWVARDRSGLLLFSVNLPLLSITNAVWRKQVQVGDEYRIVAGMSGKVLWHEFRPSGAGVDEGT